MAKDKEEETGSEFDPSTGEVIDDPAEKAERGLIKTIEAQALQLAENDTRVKELEGLVAEWQGEAEVRGEELSTRGEQIDEALEDVKLAHASVVKAERGQVAAVKRYDKTAVKLAAVTRDRDVLRTELEETKADLVMALRSSGGATTERRTSLSAVLHHLNPEHDAGKRRAPDRGSSLSPARKVAAPHAVSHFSPSIKPKEST